MLPDYQLKVANEHNIPIGDIKKLFPNFFDREKYVFHCATCNFMQDQDQNQKKHRVLEFNQ